MLSQLLEFSYLDPKFLSCDSKASPHRTDFNKYLAIQQHFKNFSQILEFSPQIRVLRLEKSPRTDFHANPLI